MTEDYDEFGNYIGPELSDSDSASSVDAEEPQLQHDDQMEIDVQPGEHELEELEAGPSNAIILHDDKTYYPSAQSVYGPDVEIMVQEEDAQPLSVPIIEPVVDKRFRIGVSTGPPRTFKDDFLVRTSQFPEMIRNVAVVGHLHHGKTSLLDMLIYQTHEIDYRTDASMRYTDTHTLTTDRKISLKSTPISLVLPTSKSKSYLINFIDTPGHTNFLDEVACSASIVDGLVLVVDVIEGVLLTSETVLRHAIKSKIPVTVVLNKIDRLILELRLPVSDAYVKIRHTIEEINTIISEVNPSPELRVSPERGNVTFASSSCHGSWAFTLKSWVDLYIQTYGPVDSDKFADRLWGNIYYNPETRKFGRSPSLGWERTFEYFVLQPIWKIYAQVIGEETATLQKTLKSLGIHFKPTVFKMDAKPLLKAVCDAFFGAPTGLVDMIVQHIPDPIKSAKLKISNMYTGPQEDTLARAMKACDPNGPLVVQIAKVYPSSDAREFKAFGRIWSGTAKEGARVRVLGESYTPEDEEDSSISEIKAVQIAMARYEITVSEMSAGNLVLLVGVDESITKYATIVPAEIPPSIDNVYIFRPPQQLTISVLKISIEPLVPSELPKMLDGLRKVNKTYPLLETRVEESGEHIIIGTGELYLDCVLFDLREMFGGVEIKVGDPVVRFCESVVETSTVKCWADTPNKQNKLTMISEPLEKGIAEDIENGKITIRMPPRETATYLEKNYGWDILAGRSIWAFGPEESGPNVLLDDTLPSEVDKKLLYSVKDSIKQGFQWACREGPLCDEPIRNVKFRILGADLANEGIYRGGGQIIPTARRVCYSSLLMATPRLMEPVYFIQIVAPQECIPIVYEILARRRGHVTKDFPKPGSPLYIIQAYIPIIDSSGFETDLRTHTNGLGFCVMLFDHWSLCPGDPLDSSIVFRPLEPAPPQALARDFVLKTRRRKGLGDGINVAKYLENDLVLALASTGVLDGM